MPLFGISLIIVVIIELFISITKKEKKLFKEIISFKELN